MISSKAQNLMDLLNECQQEYDNLIEEQKAEFEKTKAVVANFLQKSEQIHGTLGKASAKLTETPAKKKAPVEGSKRGRKREGISLKGAILEVLSRSENKAGLNSTAIAEIIHSEKLWTTNGTLGTQVGTNLFALKGDGKIEKDGKLYKIV